MEQRRAGVPLNEPATGLLGDGGCLRDVLPNGEDSSPANRDLFFAGGAGAGDVLAEARDGDGVAG